MVRICKLLPLLLLLPLYSSAQSQPAPKPEKLKVLLIPFEPRLYISEADRNINKETKMTFKQIVHAFRKGLDGVLGNQFKTAFTVVSLMNDTTKSASDLKAIYGSVGYNYSIAPGPDQLLPPKEQAKPKTNPAKGHLDTEMQGNEKKFMNTKVSNTALFSALNKKYKADVFVFVNELDIKATPDFDDATQSYKREVAVHYSVFDKSGKALCAGLAETTCPSSENVPAKITSNYFTALAKTIFDRTQKALGVN